MPRWLLRTSDEEARWALLFLTEDELARVHELTRAVAQLEVVSIAVWSSVEWYRELPIDGPEPEIIARIDGVPRRDVPRVHVDLSQLEVSSSGFCACGIGRDGMRVSTEEIELVRAPPKPVLPRVRAWDDVEWGLVRRGDAVLLAVGVWFEIGPSDEIPRALVELSEERRAEIRAVVDRLRALLTMSK